MTTAASLAAHASTRSTPQDEPISGKPMVPNSASGFSFQVDDWERLRRGLILGSEGGTYYIGERKLTKENVEAAGRCALADPARAVKMLVDIDHAGLAPKKSPALLTAAYFASLPGTKKLMLEQLGSVCRTVSHLMEFVGAAEQFRGWGRSLRRAVARWFEDKPTRDLAYQCMKYKARGGWACRDLLRLSHPRVKDEAKQKLLKHVAKPEEPWPVPDGAHDDLDPVHGWFLAKLATDAKGVAKVIREYGLVRECVPTEHLKSPEVWEALLERMPMTAMIRNLAAMTNSRLIAPLSAALKNICDRLRDKELLKRARIHPIAVLLALTTYQSGHGFRGKLTWTPVSQVCEALEECFYACFTNVEATGKRFLLGVDVSASMDGNMIAGMHLDARMGSCAMAVLAARTEPQHQIMAFSHCLVPLPITSKTSLADAIKIAQRTPMGGTDCSLPMRYAIDNKLKVDVFISYTDAESWAGGQHPSQALEEYRQKSGIGAKAIAVGMTANQFSVLDPSDLGGLNVVGFDSSVPELIRNFVLDWKCGGAQAEE